MNVKENDRDKPSKIKGCNCRLTNFKVDLVEEIQRKLYDGKK